MQLTDLQFLTRLQYVAFKRTIWMIETILFVAVCVMLLMANMPPHIALACFVIALLRVITEMCNHAWLANYHNVPDRWSFLYPFG